jgi:hypothetical protein
MITTAPTQGRRFALLLTALAMLLAMLPATPSQADPVAVAVAGTANLTGGFNNAITAPNAPGCFSGTAAGSHSGPASATFNYTNDLLQGTANGTLNLPGHSVGFTWTRVGATAVLTLSGGGHSGNAVAAFAPVGPPSLATPSCGSQALAQVVGVGVLS